MIDNIDCEHAGTGVALPSEIELALITYRRAQYLYGRRVESSTESDAAEVPDAAAEYRALCSAIIAVLASAAGRTAKSGSQGTDAEKNTDDLNRMLIADNSRMRKAGLKLAEAALRVIREYDGTHRLALAVSEWAIALADEGGRASHYKHDEARNL